MYRPQKIVWHGSDARGKRLPGSYCRGWDSDKVDSTGMASSLMDSQLLQNQQYACNNAFILLCVENTYRHDAFIK